MRAHRKFSIVQYGAAFRIEMLRSNGRKVLERVYHGGWAAPTIAKFYLNELAEKEKEQGRRVVWENPDTFFSFE